MTEKLRFTSAGPGDLDRPDIQYKAVSRIMLGGAAAGAPATAPTSPPWASSFIVREFKACDDEFRSLQSQIFELPSPRDGALVAFEYSFIPRLYPTMTLPIFKVYGTRENRFCLVYSSLTSRVTHIVVPDSNCVIYDLDRDRAQFAWDAFATHNHQAHSSAYSMRRRIGLVDMVTSYAHQAMNHLSGIQRLIDYGAADALDEIWVAGVEFFGSSNAIFPELSDRVRLTTRREALEHFSSGGHHLFKIGSNFMTSALRERLLRLPHTCLPAALRDHGRWPILAITIRSGQRRCLNLAEVVDQLVTRLLATYPRLGVVLDGWVFPETQIVACSNVITAVSEPHRKNMIEEGKICQAISARIPPGVLIRNTVGLSMLESMHALSDVDIYFSHVGTLQHKLGWFTHALGIVHGPRAELSRMEASYYSVEGAVGPNYFDSAVIIDVPSQDPIDQRSRDYSISDMSSAIATIEGLIAAKNLQGSPAELA